MGELQSTVDDVDPELQPVCDPRGDRGVASDAADGVGPGELFRFPVWKTLIQSDCNIVVDDTGVTSSIVVRPLTTRPTSSYLCLSPQYVVRAVWHS